MVQQETVWLGGILVAILRKPVAANPIQISYIHTDHLTTPRLIVNQSNTPVWRWDNVHTFGANLPDEDPDGNSQIFEYNPRFPGQYFDRETALHYNYFRYYEPETGRYLTPDPIGLAGGLNVYGYVENDPISWIDPDGLVRNRGNSNPRSIVPNPGNRPGGWSYGQFYPSIGNAPPRTANYPVGSSRSQFQVPPKAQQSGGNVCGRDFSGHAFDQMQARGIMPTVVENTLKTGQPFPTRLGTSGFYDPINNIRVITNSETGRIVTVIPGTP